MEFKYIVWNLEFYVQHLYHISVQAFHNQKTNSVTRFVLNVLLQIRNKRLRRRVLIVYHTPVRGEERGLWPIGVFVKHLTSSVFVMSKQKASESTPRCPHSVVEVWEKRGYAGNFY